LGAYDLFLKNRKKLPMTSFYDSFSFQLDILLFFPEIFIATASISLLLYGVILGNRLAPYGSQTLGGFPSNSKIENSNMSVAMPQAHTIGQGDKENLVWLGSPISTIVSLCSLSLVLTSILVLNGPIAESVVFFQSFIVDEATFFLETSYSYRVFL